MERTRGSVSSAELLAGILTRSPSGKFTPGRAIFSDAEWIMIARWLQLSTREAQLVICAFDDEKESVIANRLGISPHTVHTHFERLYRKLSVHSRCQLLIRIVDERLHHRA